MKKNENIDKDIILVAKMYTGEYIQKNIGHEIINFFKPNDGQYYYGYIIYNGKIEKNKCKRIKSILLVSDVKDRKIEILAKIDNPEFISNVEDTRDLQKKYIQKNNIKYGGVLLDKIMEKKGTDDYGIYITYKARKIEKPKEKFYILLNDSVEKENSNNIKLSWNIGHNYGFIPKSDFNQQKDIEEEDINYKKINEKMIEIKWKEIEEIKIKDVLDKYPFSNEDNTFMDLINKEYDETVFSNMMYYYFYKKKMFKDFAKEVLKVELSNDIILNKEKSTESDLQKGRIDIFAEDNNNKVCIVIENKLKSGINGKNYSVDAKNNDVKTSQLTKYVQWIQDYKENKKSKYENYQKHFYIFVPNYKKDELIKDIKDNNLMPKDEKGNDLYVIITYDKIFNYFNSKRIKEKMSEDKYYNDFLSALSNHIYTADKEMERKFVNAIKKVDKN